jgi:hypothetical protein
MRISHRKRIDKLDRALSKNRESFKGFEHKRSISDASEKVTNSLLELSHRWVAAERNLHPPRFEECCRSQKVTPRSPVLKKLKTIGADASRLYDFSYNLPCRIDALYECAKLTSETLKTLIKEGRMHRFITDAELKKVIRSLKSPK